MAVTEEVKVRKHNLRLYPKYLMLGYDLLFFYGIRVMFLLDVKGITESQILLAATVYALSMIVMQVPATLLASKIGYKNTAIAGNIFNIIWAILMITFDGFAGLALSQFISGVAFALKFVSEPNLLSTSIPQAPTYQRNEIFSRLDKKGFSRYCIFQQYQQLYRDFCMI